MILNGCLGVNLGFFSLNFSSLKKSDCDNATIQNVKFRTISKCVLDIIQIFHQHLYTMLTGRNSTIINLHQALAYTR